MTWLPTRPGRASGQTSEPAREGVSAPTSGSHQAADQAPTPTSTDAATPRPTRRHVVLGLALVAVGVAVAAGVNQLVPAVSALTVAVVLGFALGNLPVRRSWAAYDAALSSLSRPTKLLLRGGVVLLGLQLAVPDVLALGGGTLIAVLLIVTATFAATLLFGRLLRLPRGTTLLVGTGVCICGASAIAAMEGVVERRREDVATALAVVTLYGTLAIVCLPLSADLLGLAPEALGTWAGLSVHEVAQVVAAASPAGAAAISVAVVIKLSRVVLLAPLVAGVGLAERRRAGHARADTARPPLVPGFVLGFLAMVAITSTGVVPAEVRDAASLVSTLCLAGALFGLGVSIRLGPLLRTGGRALLVGLASSLLMALGALGAVAVLV